MTPVLATADDFVWDPRGGHALVLRLACQLAEELGEPVEREVFAWYADALGPNDEADEAVAALDAVLGPRPRVSELYVVLGDLVDAKLLEQSPDGFSITKAGWEARDELQRKGTPDFKRVVAHYA